MLLISFIIIFTLKKKGDSLKNRYVKKDCPVDWYQRYTEDGKGLKVNNEGDYKDWYSQAEG